MEDAAKLWVRITITLGVIGTLWGISGWPRDYWVLSTGHLLPLGWRVFVGLYVGMGTSILGFVIWGWLVLIRFLKDIDSSEVSDENHR